MRTMGLRGGPGYRQGGGKLHKVGRVGIDECVRSTCDAHAAHPTKHAGYPDLCSGCHSRRRTAVDDCDH